MKHVQDHKCIQGVLKEAKGRADRIHKNVQLFKELTTFETLNTSLAAFFDDAVQDFQKMETELAIIQYKVTNYNIARTFLTSPQTLTQLEGIEKRLAHKENNIQIMGMIAGLLAESRSIREDNRNMQEKIDEVHKLIQQLKTSIDMGPSENALSYVIQAKSIKMSCQRESSQRDEWWWINAMGADDQMAMGISWYQGNYQFKKDYVKSARFFHSALKAGKSDANYYIGMLY